MVLGICPSCRCKTLKRELLTDKRTARAYSDLVEEYDVAHALIAARVRAGLSQSQVAARMGTTQSVVARLEGGGRTPSMRTVERFARAVGGRLIVRIEPASTGVSGHVYHMQIYFSTW
ncbi:MAG: helix-turn-helix domain-containing protein [Steroidobacteraceae bacterium]